MLCQFLAGVTPLGYLYLFNDTSNQQQLVSFELFLGYSYFCIALVNYSTDTFVAKRYRYYLHPKNILKLIRLRLTVSLLACMVILTYVACFKSPEALWLILILIGATIDASWVFIGKKKIYVSSLIVGATYILAGILFLNLSLLPHSSFAIAYIIVAVGGCLLTYDFRKVSDLCWSSDNELRKALFWPTINELLTLAAYRLDLVVFAIFCPVEQMYVYALIKKHVQGFQSVLLSGVKLIYLSESTATIKKLKSIYGLMLLTLPLCGGLLSLLSLKYFFEMELSFIEIIYCVLFFCFSSYFAFLKQQAQFEFLYRKFLLFDDLKLSVFVYIMFIMLCGVVAFLELEGLLFMILIKTANDLWYVLAFKMKYRLSYNLRWRVK